MYSSVKYHGPFLGAVRRWIQRTFCNGDQVTWGSQDILEPRYNLTPKLFEDLACEVRDAVIRQFRIKDTDHEYQYAVFCTGSGKFIQHVDTAKEIWTALFDCSGPVRIVVNDGKEKSLYQSKCLFEGDAEGAKVWIQRNRGTFAIGEEVDCL